MQFCHNILSGIVNSLDPDKTAPEGAQQMIHMKCQDLFSMIVKNK